MNCWTLSNIAIYTKGMHRPENAHKLSEMKEVLLKMMSYNKTTPICNR